MAPLLLSLALLAPQSAQAQIPSGWTRIDDRLPADGGAASTIEYLLTKLRLEAVPAAPTDIDHEASYKFNGSPWPFAYFQGGDGSIRNSSFPFHPSADFETVCTALIDAEAARVFSDDVRKGLGIKLRPVPMARSWLLPVEERPSDRYARPLVLASKTTWGREQQGDTTFYNIALHAGDLVNKERFPPYESESDFRSEWVNRVLTTITYRSDKGECFMGGHWGGLRIRIPVTIGARDIADRPQTAAAPKARENRVARPRTGGPVLTRTGPPPPKPEAPQSIVHKPGERPKPPEAPKLPPCPQGMSCAVGEGAPPTPEGLAYMEKMRAYEAEVKAFEAGEAAQRQAVADLNKQKQAEYSAQLAAAEKEHADALAARQARIDADNAAYQAQLKAHQAESERIQREHDAAMAEWRRKSAACLAGDMSQCANSDDK
ncbi:hypothetical protein [Sphingopyxis sp. KK2]|uniref:hypothetical protein n=1 Tax=Sphingopyxis sp. KK2 TaxID=1855727 RepID=UPI00097E67AC|nr:hypothetical protein [Sphingopyxis sp. KK2]